MRTKNYVSREDERLVIWNEGSSIQGIVWFLGVLQIVCNFVKEMVSVVNCHLIETFHNRGKDIFVISLGHISDSDFGNTRYFLLTMFSSFFNL